MPRLALVCLALSLSLSPALADYPCDELWAERNATYKDAGYCFKTAAAIRQFGNAGCQYDNMADVPLSDSARRKVAEIVAEERRNGCSR